MADPTARLLALLALLQTGPGRSGTDLAVRLGVSSRTVRHDIERLRELGYPVDATRGSVGGYRLGAGGTLPPLLLDDEEAVAVTVGLRAAAGIAGVEESGARALAKLEQVLPSHLRPTVDALRSSVDRAPENNDTDAPDPEVDAASLQAIARAIRDQEWLRFDYEGLPGWSSRIGCSPGCGAGTSWHATPTPTSGERTGSTGWICGCRRTAASTRDRSRVATTRPSRCGPSR